jgi:hypothetical protein
MMTMMMMMIMKFRSATVKTTIESMMTRLLFLMTTSQLPYSTSPHCIITTIIIITITITVTVMVD